MKLLLSLVSAILVITTVYSQPGSIDKTFGENGFVTTKKSSDTRAIVQQQDGKLLVAGGFDNDPRGYVARFLPDGTIDSSFGTNGFAGFPSRGGAYDLILEADNKILIVGAVLNEDDKSTYFVARFQSDGSFDSSFGENGISFIPHFGDFSGYSNIKTEPDGSIIIAGGGTTDAEETITDYMILSHVSANGVFDNSFGTNGRVLKSFDAYSGVRETCLAIQQEDGKILLGGYVEDGGYYQDDYVLCRYNSDGTPDNSFGTNGTVITQGVQGLEGHDAPCGIVVQPDGKIVLGGTSDGYNYITYMTALRYEQDGTLDKSFGTNGRAFINFTGKLPQANAIVMQPDGKLILAGVTSDIITRYYDFALCRFTANGVIDSSFAIDGRQLTTYKNAATAYCATLQQDGKIVLGGSYYDINKGPSYLLVRYNGDKEQQSLIAKIKHWLNHHGISWQGLDNKNISYYSVQYSATGKGFTEKGKVSGTGSSRMQDYNFTVADAGYYRIVAVDSKGYKTFSNKVMVSSGDLLSSASIYPNPVRDYVNVQGLPTNKQTNISIANGSGTVLAKGVSSGSTQYRAPASNLQPGTYYLNITTGSTTETLKFVKE